MTERVEVKRTTKLLLKGFHACRSAGLGSNVDECFELSLLCIEPEIRAFGPRCSGVLFQETLNPGSDLVTQFGEIMRCCLVGLD
ncbi:hypothetical protein BIY45_00965 [Stenotrophomonas sp. BIIR7]|nr:hypothetical protein BIY45_00965 [Stenotrophomonas sp. BIIR7]